MTRRPAKRLSLYLLGTPEVRVAGTPLALHDQKARALLYYLAVTGCPHTRDHLAALLWGESSPKNARHSLRTSLYRLRQSLRPDGAREVLTTSHELLALNLDDDRDVCDVQDVRALMAERTTAAWEAAAAQFRGPLLQGFTLSDAPAFEEWVRYEETRLQHTCLDLLQRLADRAEASRDWVAVIGYAQGMVHLDPLAADGQRRLIQAYVQQGAAGQALRQYQDYEDLLRQELGQLPPHELRMLLEEARHPSAPLGSPPAVRPSPAALPFVGRDQVLSQIVAASRQPLAGTGVTVLIEGEGGIGKTRLLDELVASLAGAAGSWTFLRGSCSPFDHLLSYGPFLEALQGLQAAGLANGLEGTVPDARGQFVARLLQALRAAAQGGPMLLAIDDLQWANSSTLNLFGFLATRLQLLPILLVGTVQRVEAIPALQRLVTLGRRRGELQLFSLEPLPPEAIKALLHSLGVTGASTETLAAWLPEQSGGNPFLVREIMAQLQTEGVVRPAGPFWELDYGRWLPWRAAFALPVTTHDLVTWRLANLGAESRRLLEVLAVAGEPLPVRLVGDVLEIAADDLAPITEDLIRRGLLLELANGHVALAHNLLRETLLHHQSQLRRRSLHRRLSARLEAEHPSGQEV